MRKAIINQNACVACGTCIKVCPRQAIEIYRGCYAKVDFDRCVGCSLCVKDCPASIIEVKEHE